MAKYRSFSRKVGNRETKARFLIVCEGTKTEPLYFESFKMAEVKALGCAYDPLSLVQFALEKAKEEEYDQVWCVFDRDDVPIDKLNNAFFKALQNKIGIAYSNEAFELWYLLHFEYLNTGESRCKYEGKLSKYLNKTYKKNDDSMYDLIFSKQADAIRNAKKLLHQYDDLLSAKGNPSTTVHFLVEELNNNGKENDLHKKLKQLQKIFKYNNN